VCEGREEGIVREAAGRRLSRPSPLLTTLDWSATNHTPISGGISSAVNVIDQSRVYKMLYRKGDTAQFCLKSRIIRTYLRTPKSFKDIASLKEVACLIKMHLSYFCSTPPKKG
jgi:hypothetical protein